MSKYIAIPLLLMAGAASAQDDGPLRAPVDPTFVPHAMTTLAGGLEGFNIDLAHAIGEQLGREIEIIPTEWSGIPPGLEAGTYDFNASPTTATAERAENLLFTEGYIDTDFQFLVPAGSDEHNSLEDFSGMTVAVNRGSTYSMWAQDLEAELGWTVANYGTSSDAVEAVTSGRADAMIAGNTYVGWIASRNPNVDMSFVHETGSVFATTLAPRNVELRNQIDRAIECLKVNGTIAELHEKWFGYAPAEGSTAVTPVEGYGIPGLNGYEESNHTPGCD